MCHEPSICFVILIGIPASGKTHLKLCLQQWFVNPSNDNENIYIVPISYDDCIDKLFITAEESTWKIKRMEIYKSVENALNMLKGNSSDDSFAQISFNINIARQSKSVVFIIDDNMFYRSMRYEYYKLAKKYAAGFCQFYLKTSLEAALEKNRARNVGIVPDSTIRNMFSKLEPPDVNNKWEELTLEIESYSDFNGTLMKTVVNRIKHCLENPVISQLENVSATQEDTNANVIHQVDLIVRRMIGEKIKTAISLSKNKQNIKNISDEYCIKKHKLLQKIKTGDIVLPLTTTENISQNDIQCLIMFLEQHI